MTKTSILQVAKIFGATMLIAIMCVMFAACGAKTEVDKKATLNTNVGAYAEVTAENVATELDQVSRDMSKLDKGTKATVTMNMMGVNIDATYVMTQNENVTKMLMKATVSGEGQNETGYIYMYTDGETAEMYTKSGKEKLKMTLAVSMFEDMLNQQLGACQQQIEEAMQNFASLPEGAIYAKAANDTQVAYKVEQKADGQVVSTIYVIVEENEIVGISMEAEGVSLVVTTFDGEINFDTKGYEEFSMPEAM